MDFKLLKAAVHFLHAEFKKIILVPSETDNNVFKPLNFCHPDAVPKPILYSIEFILENVEVTGPAFSVLRSESYVETCNFSNNRFASTLRL